MSAFIISHLQKIGHGLGWKRLHLAGRAGEQRQAPCFHMKTTEKSELAPGSWPVRHSLRCALSRRGRCASDVV